MGPTATGETVMIFLNGRDRPSFRCQCGCNVFMKDEPDGDVYTCNACGLEYRGE